MKANIRTSELPPLIHTILTENNDWIVTDAIDELRQTYKIDPKKYNSIKATYSRWKKNNSNHISNIKDLDNMIKLITTGNITDYLVNHKDTKFQYIHKRLTGHKTPLRSDAIQLLRAVREMLREFLA